MNVAARSSRMAWTALARGIDPGEHHQAGQPGGVGAGDIGVHPVTDDEWSLKVAARQRIEQQGRCRLAC